MTEEKDQARTIAERVARRVASGRSGRPSEKSLRIPPRNGAPVGEELSAIRTGLHDLERKLERIESKITQGAEGQPAEPPRARLIDFVSSAPPLATSPSIASSAGEARHEAPKFVPPTHSPWLATISSRYAPPSRQDETENPQSAIRNPQSAAHPSQERFGVEEATVSELVEFFESEKKCSVEPGGKACDHCAMCSSRGF